MSWSEKLTRLYRAGFLSPRYIPGLLASGLHGIWRQWTRDGTFRTDLEVKFMASHRPEKLIDAVIREYRPSSVLDLGCGSGAALDHFVERGVTDAWGVEGSSAAIGLSARPERIRLHDLRRPLDLGRRFDLIYSYEFLEHVAPAHVETLVDTFARHSDRIVMTAAVPGQGGYGHFNEQPPEYWIDLFGRRGFRLDETRTAMLRGIPEAYCDHLVALARPSSRPKEG